MSFGMEEWGSAGYLVAAFLRACGMLFFLPWDSQQLSGPMRALIACVCALLAPPGELIGDRPMLIILTFEFVIGACLALPVALVVEGAAFVGELFDSLRGQTIATVHAPLSGVQSVSAAAASQVTFAVVLAGGGLLALTRSYFGSFTAFPAGGVELAFVQERAYLFLLQCCATFGAMLTLVAPLALLGLLVDVGVGYLGKIAPQASFQGEAFLLKTALGLLVVGVLTEQRALPELIGRTGWGAAVVESHRSVEGASMGISGEE